MIINGTSTPGPWRSTRRRAFTVLELTAALAGLAVAMVFVGQIAFWSMTDRRRTATRYEALEAAGNILEIAQATTWDALTPDWAASQRLPADLTLHMYEPKLTVRVDTDASRPYVKRVTVEIAWMLDAAVPAAPVVLTGWFSARSAPRQGGTP